MVTTVFSAARWVVLFRWRREPDDVLETQRPSPLLGRMGGPSLGAWRHPLLMVGTDPLEVDQLLAGGELRCPDCAGELRPWGHARGRGVREEHGVVTVRPRRSSCAQCRCTHVLLPASMLVRRADAVAVIGQALLAHTRGVGHRSIAAGLGRPVSTVRGWLRRFGLRADSLRCCSPGCSTCWTPAPRRWLRPGRCSPMPLKCWVWPRPRRPGCSGPDRPGSSPPRSAAGCCSVPPWRPIRADVWAATCGADSLRPC